MDVGAGAAHVAGLDVDVFAEEFVDERLEGSAAVGEGQGAEGDVGGLQGTGQRTDEVTVWGVYVLRVDQLLPEIVHPLGLLDSEVCEVRVTPGGCAVAVDEGPVALDDISLRRTKRSGTYIPCGPAIVLVSSVVPSLAMTAQEQDLIVNIGRGFVVQIDDLVIEPLPLSECGIRRLFPSVCTVDQSKVRGCLIDIRIQIT